MASEDAPLIGHVASLRKLAVELRDAIAGATMQQRVADRVNQIARAARARGELPVYAQPGKR